MRSRAVTVLAVLTAWCTLVAAAQQVHAEPPDQRRTAPSGRRLYLSYCASCHGKDGKGDGPAAAALRTPPSNLTTLTKRNNGKFPYDQVSRIIKGESEHASHGSKGMPVWGPIFLAQGGSDEAEVEERIQKLTRYIQSLQSDLEALKKKDKRAYQRTFAHQLSSSETHGLRQ